jgi:hypothetical protein
MITTRELAMLLVGTVCGAVISAVVQALVF